MLGHLSDVHVPTLVLGVTTAALMILGSHWWPRAPIALIGMLAATAVVAVFDLSDEGVQVIGDIPSALPRFTAPAVGWRRGGEPVALRHWGWRSWRTPTTSSPRGPSRSVHHPIDPPPGAARPGRGEPGRRADAGLPGQQQRQPDGDRDCGGQRAASSPGSSPCSGPCSRCSSCARSWPPSPVPPWARSSCTPRPGWSTYRSSGGWPDSARSELVLALAHDRGGPGGRRPVGRPGRDRALARSTCCAGWRAPRRDPGLRPRPGRHARRRRLPAGRRCCPGLIVYRYDSPLFFANAEDFKTPGARGRGRRRRTR